MTSMISTSDGTELHVSVWGEGPPVLLTHAWALNGQMWDYQIPALTAAGSAAWSRIGGATEGLRLSTTAMTSTASPMMSERSSTPWSCEK